MTLERPKITDLYEDKIVTRTERGESGQLEKFKKVFRQKRPVNDLSIGLRLVNIVIDIAMFRILAYIIDETQLFSSIPFIGLIFLFLFPIYYILTEYYFQQTVGKFFTKSIVIDEYGERPDFKTIVVRTVIRFIPFEPFSFFSSNRGWHDKWTKTYVIRKDENEKIRDLLTNPDNLEPSIKTRANTV